jgi:hypothetical protein
MRMKLQAQVNGKWAYVSHTNGSLVTTSNAHEAVTADTETINRLSAEFYGTDFRAVR